MEDKLLEEIIEDYERLLGIVSNRLNELKAMRRGDGKTDSCSGPIKRQIERKRKEILAQVETARAATIRSKEKDG